MGWNRKIIALSIFLFAFIAMEAQVSQNRYLVYFSSKENTPYSISQPSAFLSDRAIVRRQNQDIAIDSKDLPIDPANIQMVRDLGAITVLAQVKWFNAILIESTDFTALQALLQTDGIDRLEVSTVIPTQPGMEAVFWQKPTLKKADSDYGPSLNQIEMLNGVELHNDGFAGQGKWIAVMDGGFSNTNTAAAFETLRAENRILHTENFVDGNADVYQRSGHGSYVLSTMAGLQVDSLIGTAPQASYGLFITEDVGQERRIEEAFYAVGLAYADSAGYDIVNTSLGYTQFDVIEDNYTYSDMDGNTALITNASDVAASRGMLMVSSAGNLGNQPWFHIGAPADGDSVLAIGSVDSQEIVSPFSSRGPSFDGRVKPNVMAQGSAAVLSDLESGIFTANGTSFAAPIVSGLAACLWQAHPAATSMQVHRAIEMSAHLFEMPNDSMGFGIPDFEIARQILDQVLSIEDGETEKEAGKIFPNPYSGGALNVVLPAGATRASYRIFDLTGRMRAGSGLVAAQELGSRIAADFGKFGAGVYLIAFVTNGGERFISKLHVQ